MLINISIKSIRTVAFYFRRGQCRLNAQCLCAKSITGFIFFVKLLGNYCSTIGTTAIELYGALWQPGQYYWSRKSGPILFTHRRQSPRACSRKWLCPPKTARCLWWGTTNCDPIQGTLDRYGSGALGTRVSIRLILDITNYDLSCFNFYRMKYE